MRFFILLTTQPCSNGKIPHVEKRTTPGYDNPE